MPLEYHNYPLLWSLVVGDLDLHVAVLHEGKSSQETTCLARGHGVLHFNGSECKGRDQGRHYYNVMAILRDNEHKKYS